MYHEGLAAHWGFQPPALSKTAMECVRHHDELGNYVWGVGGEQPQEHKEHQEDARERPVDRPATWISRQGANADPKGKRCGCQPVMTLFPA